MQKKKKSERNILFDFMGAQTSSQSNKIRKEKKKSMISEGKKSWKLAELWNSTTSSTRVKYKTFPLMQVIKQNR